MYRIQSKKDIEKNPLKKFIRNRPEKLEEPMEWLWHISGTNTITGDWTYMYKLKQNEQHRVPTNRCGKEKKVGKKKKQEGEEEWIK